MGIFAELIDRRSSPANPDAWLINGVRGYPSAAGVRVDADEALSSTAVWAAVRLVSETVASVPLHLYRQQGRRKEVARDHQTYELLYRSPNPELTSFELREMLHANLELSGSAFAEIVWRGGYPRELWPLWSDRMTVERRDGVLRYRYRLPNGRDVVLLPRNVLHVPGFRRGGLTGISTVEQTDDAIGLAIALQTFAGKFFGNGAHMGGVLRHPGRLSKEAKDALREQIQLDHGGLDNALRPMILQEGMEWEQRGVSPEQAQALESRKFSVAEVARIFNVPPHLLKDLDRATYNNIEHQSIEFVRYAVRPRAVRWEQRLEKSILTEGDRQQHYVRFNLEGLLRGDLKTRYEAYSIGRQNGWLSANDVRDLEDQNPIETGGGDDYHVQLNMVPLDASRDVIASDDGDDPEPGPVDERTRTVALETRARRAATSRRRLESAHRSILEDVAQRMLNGECRRLRKEIESHLTLRSVQSLKGWLEQFYRDWPQDIARAFMPALKAYAEMVGGAVQDEVGGDSAPSIDEFVQRYAETMGIRWSAQSRRQLQSIIDRVSLPELQSALLAKVDEWQEERAAMIGRDEANQANNAFAKAAYIAAGVMALRWVTLGDSCPFCRQLDGKTVGVRGWFVDAGSEIKGGDGTQPLRVSHKIGHPPLHSGCDCQVVAGL